MSSCTQSTLLHIGGEVNKENQSTVGTIAEKVIHMLNIDVAFISTSSWDINGLSTPDPSKIPVKRAILEVSTRCILVSDFSKYDTRSPFRICPLTAFDQLITDNKIPLSVVDAIQEKHIRVIY